MVLHPTGATSVEFSSAGDLAVGTVDGSVRVIDPANGRVRALLRQHTLDVNDLSFDAKGQYLYVASIDGTASVWAMNNLSAPQLIYTNHQAGAPAGEIVDALRAIALNPNNDLVATAGQQGIIHLWRPTTGETLRTLSQEGTAQINALVFSPRTGTRLAAANVSGEVVIWDVAAGQALRTIASDGQIGSLLFSTDERQLLVGTQGGELRIKTGICWASTPCIMAILLACSVAPMAHFLPVRAAIPRLNSSKATPVKPC
jgi:WD40 repeat protein